MCHQHKHSRIPSRYHFGILLREGSESVQGLSQVVKDPGLWPHQILRYHCQKGYHVQTKDAMVNQGSLNTHI